MAEHVSYFYVIGSLSLELRLLSSDLTLDVASGSYSFLTQEPHSRGAEITIDYKISERIEQFAKDPVFVAESFDDNMVPFKWYIYENDGVVFIEADLNDTSQIKKAVAKICQKDKIEVALYLRKGVERLRFDPFFQPWGAILLHYLAHENSGVLLHSSGVNDGKNGYVFTAVSGTGKSTIAALWQSEGAQIINDDRLILMPQDAGVMMSNTPMPYYQDVYKESPVTAVFLIKQSSNNYIKPLPGVAGVAGLMANCIQFLYDKKMVQKHLNSLTAIAERCPIYELGFKPDTEIVEIIRSEFRGK
jgi:hypothetical protein